METELLKGLLLCLEPETLAYIVRDLEHRQADGQDCLGRPLAEPLQQELGRIIQQMVQVGAELTTGGEERFLELVEEARDEQEKEWAWQRAQQERQNWLDDYQ